MAEQKARCAHLFFVIAGLDPAIHPSEKLSLRWMDARIKSGHDACVMYRQSPSPVIRRVFARARDG
jgi:hypothetical protein